MNPPKIKLFNYDFDNLTYEEAIQQILDSLNQKKFNYIVTANPEILLAAQASPDYAEKINQAQFLFADGTGIIIANRLINKTKLHKITGMDLTIKLLDKPLSFYFLGAKPEVLEKVVKCVQKTHKKSTMAGHHHGYFKPEEIPEIIKKIKVLKPDIILVGLGAPKQENFLYQLQQELDHGIGIGVGGVFDVLSGTKKRAPKFFQVLGIEWIYRGITEPRRLVRWKFIPKFIGLILKEIWHNRTK